ncbi:MAG: hypothetical protein Q7T18_12370 [Sedimentisphaerales bacterium]|nr:hypothetical protein [Sedimentisphaerales bacterium]
MSKIKRIFSGVCAGLCAIFGFVDSEICQPEPPQRKQIKKRSPLAKRWLIAHEKQARWMRWGNHCEELI